MFTFNFNFAEWHLPFFKRKPKVVLIVEDDNMVVELIRRAAEANGYEIDVADSAEEALGILHRNGKRFVLAMMDVHLPGMSGWMLRNKIMRANGKFEILNAVRP